MKKEWEILKEKISKELVENLKNAIKYDQAWQVSGVPKNFVTGKAYQGINQFMLGFFGQYFAGEKQIKSKKGRIIDKSKFYYVSCPYFVNDKKINTVSGKEEKIRKCIGSSYKKVYSIENVEGIKVEEISRGKKIVIAGDAVSSVFVSETQLSEDQKDDKSDLFFESQEIDTRFGSVHCSYDPKLNCVHMADFKDFNSASSFYSVLAHEYTHAIGNTTCKEIHPDVKNYSSKKEVRAFLEVIAEISSVFVSAHLGYRKKGISPHLQSKVDSNSQAYINEWFSILEDDPKKIFQAISLGSKAFEFMKRKNETYTRKETRELIAV